MAPRKRITVILTPDEYAKIKARAGLVPLSAWFRYLALPPTFVQMNPETLEEIPREPCKHGLKYCKKCK